MTLILTSLEIREDSLYAVALDHLEVVDALGVNRGFPKRSRFRSYILQAGAENETHFYRRPTLLPLPTTYLLFIG